MSNILNQQNYTDLASVIKYKEYDDVKDFITTTYEEVNKEILQIVFNRGDLELIKLVCFYCDLDCLENLYQDKKISNNNSIFLKEIINTLNSDDSKHKDRTNYKAYMRGMLEEYDKLRVLFSGNKPLYKQASNNKNISSLLSNIHKNLNNKEELKLILHNNKSIEAIIDTICEQLNVSKDDFLPLSRYKSDQKILDSTIVFTNFITNKICFYPLENKCQSPLECYYDKLNNSLSNLLDIKKFERDITEETYKRVSKSNNLDLFVLEETVNKMANDKAGFNLKEIFKRDELLINLAANRKNHRSDSLIKKLVDCGADINQKSSFSGQTALHIAALSKDRFMITYLIANGAKLTIKDNNKQSVNDICKKDKELDNIIKEAKVQNIQTSKFSFFGK